MHLRVAWTLSSLWRIWPAAVSGGISRVLLYTVKSQLCVGGSLGCGLSLLGAGKLCCFWTMQLHAVTLAAQALWSCETPGSLFSSALSPYPALV